MTSEEQVHVEILFLNPDKKKRSQPTKCNTKATRSGLINQSFVITRINEGYWDVSVFFDECAMGSISVITTPFI